MNNSILICLDRLGIGGVETFVYNQSIALIKRGYDVVILSKKGIYTEKFKEKGAICIDFDFETKNYYDYDKVKKIVEIIKKYNIKEAHINQIPEISTVMPACIIANIPYIAYVHMGVSLIENKELNVYNYFERQYFTFKDNFKMFFELAHKIVAITPEVGKYIQKRYEIDNQDKIIILRNSICFEEYKSISEIENAKNFLIIGRITDEQKVSIINGINMYNIIKKSRDKIMLTIIGDGNKRQEIEQYVINNDIKDVKFVGATNNVKDYIEQNDVVIGVGRCILETLSMKRIAIISGYYEMKDIVNDENIDIEMNENFGGKSLMGNTAEAIANKILNLSAEDIKELVNFNYKRIREQLDIGKNIYVSNVNEYKYDENKLLDFMLKINNILGKEEERKTELVEKNWKEHVEYKEWKEKKEKELINRIEKNWNEHVEYKKWREQREENLINQIERLKEKEISKEQGEFNVIRRLKNKIIKLKKKG